MAAIGAALEAQGQAKGPPVSHVAAVVAGNALEFYDFLTYSFFSIQIGQTFFPSQNPYANLMASLATFGAGFLTRPVGAFFIGRMGDRVGRKPAMLVTFGLMGAGMLGLALTPGYHRIGLAAPILAIAFRLIQGFALGGEVGPSTAYFIEASPPERRGFYVSLQYASQQAAVLSAGLLAVFLASRLSAQQLTDWGWRVCFLAGVAIVPFGLILRTRLVETLGETASERAAPARFATYRRLVVLSFFILTAGTIASYTLDYMSTYAQATLGMPTDISLGATVAHGLAGLVFAVVGGVLSDRFGRKPVMIAGGLATLVIVLPAFVVLGQLRTGAALYIASALIGAVYAIGAAAALSATTEQLPKAARSAALAFTYALAISCFGGSTQFVVHGLTHLTGSPLTPAYYMMASGLIGLVAMVLMRESAPVKASAGPSL
jgi:MFS family permease